MAQWDSGISWDTGSSYDINYVDYITSEHNDKPLYTSIIASLTQPLVDIQATLNSMVNKFDIDSAVGDQLDKVGEWIGVTRRLSIPLTGVYFAFNTAGVGLDQGTWHGPFDPLTHLDVLPDDSYRTLLRAKIANNRWDGTITGAYEFMQQVFPNNTFFIQDNQDMSMLIGVSGANPLNAVTYALLTGGYLNIKPAGVRIDGYVTASVVGNALFGFDVQNSLIDGFNQSCFATISGGI